MGKTMDIVQGPYLNVGWGSEKEAMYEQISLDCNEMCVESALLTNNLYLKMVVTSKLAVFGNLYI